MKFKQILVNNKKKWGAILLAFLVSFINTTSFATISKKPAQATKSQKATQRESALVNQFSVKKLSGQQIASMLNWVTVGKKKYNLCDGYYQEPEILVNNPIPPPFKKVATRISALGPVTFHENGVSILRDHVVATQPGRILTANKAYIYRDNKTDKIWRIKLVGSVHLMEYGKLIVSQSADVNLIKHSITMNQSVYHLSEKTVKELAKKAKTSFDAWGKATYIYRSPNAVLNLKNATYTTCSPLNPTWTLSAGSLKIDKVNNVGTAHDVVLRLKHIPIFYTPYFRFALKKVRKSGFLMPSPGVSNTNGFQLELPYYWNMAPNYDMTISPFYMSKRGLQLNTLFRYISQYANGKFYISFIPDDQGFKQFQQQTLSTTKVTQQNEPYLNDLAGFSDNRAYFFANNHINYKNIWESDLYINYVTDPYYFKDFGGSYSAVQGNQLLNQFDLRYNGQHWDSLFLVQAYQTLYLINQFEAPTGQYTRLPEFDTSANYPDFFKSFDFSADAQIVNFLYNSDFPPIQTFQRPIGARLHLRPTLSRPIYFASGYVIPSVAVDVTDYQSKLATNAPGESRPSFDQARTLPIVNIDSGYYFDHEFNFDGEQFLQTLEPRLFYLYVPFQNQNEFPVFDTQVLPFSFDTLFALNRFSGYDRLDNANQMTLALTSRILRASNGQQLFNFGIGIIYYFEHPKVTIPDLDNPDKLINPVGDGDTSPLFSHLSFYPAKNWSINGNLAWEPHHSFIENAGANVQYSAYGKYIVTAGYDFVKEVSGIPVDALGLSNNTQYAYGGMSWSLSDKWRALAYLYYNISKRRADGYYAGLEYSTCCWAFRLVADRSFTGNASDSTPNNIVNQYRTTYYVQFLLKGLGSAGRNNANGLLQSTLPGYTDPFMND